MTLTHRHSHPPDHSHPDIKVIKPLNQKVVLASVLTALTAGGAIAWHTLQSQQTRNIQQAEAALSQACSANLSTPDGLTSANQQVDDATRLLRSVPSLPGLGADSAQTTLQNSAACIQRVKSTVSLRQAQTLSDTAATVTATTVLSVEDWQQLQANLKQAIATLSTVPTTAEAYPQAQAQLQTTQEQLTQVEAKLQNESGAVNAYLRAVGLVEQADELIADPTPENLSDAERRVQDAIQLIEGIPGETTVSDSQAVTLTNYRNKLTTIQQQWLTNQLSPLVEKFTSFGASLNTNLSYEAYNEKWQDLREHFDTQTQGSAILGNNPVVQSLAIAVQKYEDAALVWRYCQAQNCYNSFQAGFVLDPPTITWLPETLDLQGRPLNATYTVDSTYSLIRQTRLVRLNNALEEIWRSADQSVQDAKSQLQAEGR
jgi:hypothetical protein